MKLHATDMNFRLPEPSPLEVVLGEIHACLRAGLPYAALHLALSIPDVCSSTETDPDSEARWKGTQKRYIDWCEKFLAPKFSTFNATDCWALRGGVLHNGNLTGHSSSKYDDVMFTLGGSIVIDEYISINNGGTNRSGIALDINLFCDRIVQAAREWLDQSASNDLVKQNLEHLVRFRPQGRSPHIVGVPLIS